MCELNGDGDDVPYFKNVTLVNTTYMNKKGFLFGRPPTKPCPASEIHEGKTAPKKYNFAPDITRRGAKNAPIISSNNNLINLSKTS